MHELVVNYVQDCSIYNGRLMLFSVLAV